MKENKFRIVISGGGTGGHIFPALAIADEFKKRNPENEILFVGAIGKMEMEKVPKAGYRIEGLPIVGLKRGLYLSNLLLPFKLLSSLLKARGIIKTFAPDLVVGVGGYASGPVLKMAQFMKVPTLIQEQNSFAGKTNKLLSKKAKRICVAYENMERFFPKEKLCLTGNPVRNFLRTSEKDRDDFYGVFGLQESKKTILIIGGSLGAKTLNDSVMNGLSEIQKQDTIQILWQTGARYYKEIVLELGDKKPENLQVKEFIFEMEKAYSIADLVISRSGALSVSELCLLGKASILVPSPNVAEDHQTTNALALVKSGAAEMVKDEDARKRLLQSAFDLVLNKEKLTLVGQKAKALSKPHATEEIVEYCYRILTDGK